MNTARCRWAPRSGRMPSSDTDRDRSMHPLAKSTFSLVLLAASAGCLAEVKDVAGIAVGTPFSAARAMASKINSSYRVENLQMTGTMMGFKATASQANSQAPYDQLVVLADNAGVWFVGRQQNYTKGSRVSFDELENALLQKYGEPSSMSNIGTLTKRWELYRDGRTHREKHSPGPCRTGFMKSDWTYVPGTQIGMLTNLSPTCGTLIMSEALVDNNDRMVTQLTTKVIDSQRMHDFLNAKDSAEEQERQRQLQQERSAGNKPKL